MSAPDVNRVSAAVDPGEEVALPQKVVQGLDEVLVSIDSELLPVDSNLEIAFVLKKIGC